MKKAWNRWSGFGEESDGTSLTFAIRIRERTARAALLCVGLVGTLAFGGVFVLTFVHRPGVERAAETFLTRQMARELKNHFGIDTTPALGSLVEFLLGDVPGNPKAVAIARPDLLEQAIRAMKARDDSEGEAADGDQPTTHGGKTHRRLVADLMHEVRVFTGCNWVLFALTTLMARRRRQDPGQVTLVVQGFPYRLIAAGILAATTCVAVVVYLTTQDWFWRFLAADYVGYWYLVPMGAVAAILIDVAYNDSRVTARLLRITFYWHF